jgi:hypothetical protein
MPPDPTGGEIWSMLDVGILLPLSQPKLQVWQNSSARDTFPSAKTLPALS